ncbi:MAG TPA: methylaspartate ammonia-lyase [Acholeplasmataceae bacterium]|nr:methylaspartate ammonia-lyase [Acholeplasmataceae bacterium]
MKIKNVIFTKSYTGFYFDDQAAIKMGALSDGLDYVGEPVTPGFSKIRQPGEAVSIQLVLEDGSVGFGDCTAVQYSGAGGRDPLFLADDAINFLENKIKPLLLKEDVTSFKDLAEKYDHLIIDGKRLHTAIRYGITQALLSATSACHKLTMAEIIRKEYGIKDDHYESIPVFSQSGDDRYTNADKMIIKESPVLPHALINNVEKKLGKNGEILKEYMNWLRNRIIHLRTDLNYAPILHIDTYGTIGLAFNYDVEKMVDYLQELSDIASPFHLRIEGPVDSGDKKSTMEYLRDITKMLDERKINVEIVADEWCNTLEDIIYFADNKAGHMLQIKTPDLGGLNNTIEAILYCQKANIGAYCGGTCNETDISTHASMHIAVACKADQTLAKPGMGVDEAIMLCVNEINRVCALANSRKK